MTRYKKLAVSIPGETYKALERARERLGKTRSEVIAFAIKEWLCGLEAGAARRRYVSGYLRVPETAVDAEAALAVAGAATGDWSSWKPGASSRAAEPSRRGRSRR